MWLMTKFGFYSIVQKQRGIYHIRARERRDLENLTKPGGPLEGETILAGSSDYPFRVIVGRSQVRSLLATLAAEVDYPNFKAKIDNTAGQENKGSPYHQIWSILGEKLGAYGQSATRYDDGEWLNPQPPLWEYEE